MKYNNMNINIWKRGCFAISLCFLGLLIGMLPMRVSAQQEGFEITGHMQGLKDGEKVTTILLVPGIWSDDRRDSTYVKNSEFHLKGVVPDGPREYWLQFENRFVIRLAMDNGEKITIQGNGNISTWPRRHFADDLVTITGAPYNTSLKQLAPAWFFYDRCIINLKKSAKALYDSIGFDGNKIGAIFRTIEQVNKSFAMEVYTPAPNQTDSSLTSSYPFLCLEVYDRSNHASFIADAYENLPPAFKNSLYGKKLKEFYSLCVGRPFPDFTLPTVDGAQLALKDVVKKSKVTLVHFWAINSIFRKQMQDELRSLYKIYHDKGLNIIGMSSDKYGEEWRETVKEEGFPWYNVSDMKGKDGMVEKVYHEFGTHPTIHNTTNVLIDDKGKILAWDVSGVELQWYLWKALTQPGAPLTRNDH